MNALRRNPVARPIVVMAVFGLLGTAAHCQMPPAPQPPPAASDIAASPEITALLRARKSVEKFFDQASNVVCTENVTQAMVGKNSKVNYREDSVFDYQMQSNLGSGAQRLVETRETRKAAFRDSSRTLLITNGFTSMLLIIHSSYETSYRFEPGGEEAVDGVTYEKVYFKAVPGTSSPAALQLRGQNYPLPLSGTIWIERDSGAVAKLIASMDASLSDVGLQGMRSEIHYAIVRFHDPDESYWMPVSAIIDVETPKQHWRNIHRFTGYKRFRATIQVEELGAKP
jgi:hypothetical protein